MKQTILIKKRQDDKPQFLQIMLDGPVLTREYGIVGGAVNGTSHTYTALNVGKSNEKEAELVAKEAYLRLINTKSKEGYTSVRSLDDLSVLENSREFSLENIPESFCISKPIKEISVSGIDKLLKTNNGRFFIKYNGIGHYILIRLNGDVTIYTRRWCDHTIKYPEIVKNIEDQKYPPGTLIYSEFHIDTRLQIPHMTAFLLMSQISKADVTDGVCKSEVPKSLAYQEKHRVRAALLYIIYCDNKPAHHYPLQVNFNSLNLKATDTSKGEAVFVPKEVPILSGKAAMTLVKTNKDAIEGLVLMDMTQCIEVTMNGKPNRCASWKIKARGDIDVIADGYVEGKGKYQNKIGSLKICQYDAENQRVDLGTVGGLTDADRDPKDWDFPCVIEVKYDQRFPETGKFQFGRFSKKHEDKLPENIETFNR